MFPGWHPGWAALLLAAWLLLALAIYTFVPDDPVSLALLLVLPIIPPLAHLVIYTVAQAVRGQVFCGTMIAMTTILLVSVNFRHREYGDKSIDLQVLCKIGGIALLFAIGLPHLLRFFRTDTTWVARLWLSFLFLIVVSSSYAQEPNHALLGSMSFFGSFLFVWHFGEVYGRQALVRMMLITSVVLSVSSLVVYFAIPTLGRLPDYVNGAWQLTTRLQGVVGTPNGVGLGSGFSILLALLLLEGRRTTLFWAMIALFGVCLILSNNRMAMFGLIVCAAYLFLCRGDFKLRFVMLVTVSFVAGLILYGFHDIIFSALSRTGSAEEITTGTGRAGIWAAALEIWSEHPVWGLGFNSSLQILPKRSDLFTAAAHTHNVVLEVLFSGGLIGLCLFATALIASLYAAAERRRHAEIGIVLFYMVYGMTEPIITGIVNYPTLAFFATMVLAFVSERPSARPAPVPLRVLQPLPP